MSTSDKGRDLAQPLTPKSDRTRSSYGSLLMAPPDMGCPSRKCVRKKGHDGKCYPED